MSEAATSAVAWPVDQRRDGCTCTSGINTLEELVGVIELAQEEYKAQWAAFEETAKLLESFGWKHGVNVKDEYGISTYDADDPYQLSWVVQEGVYLATGHGNIGDLNGGYQQGDFDVAERPLIKKALDYIQANPRCQRTKLTKTQQKQLRESFEMAYHMHLHFHAPMSRIWFFIHQKLGQFPNSMAIPDDVYEEIRDWFWEVRHELTSNKPELYKYTNRGSAEELIEMISKAQPLVSKRAVVNGSDD
ncbi:MAG: hypothetical protein WAK48_01480 [Candidatus Acidiferrum sp.]|jgi:hypothetical protein